MYTIDEPYKRCKRLGALIISDGPKIIYEISDTIDERRFTKVYKTLEELFEAIELKTLINNISHEHNFEVKNADKIINAKLRFFHGDNVRRCPCDADNPERFCGSAQCLKDVKENGHCHCNLFSIR